MELTDAPREDFSELYWRVLLECKRRHFKPAQRRVVEKVLDLTYGRDKSDVRIARLDDLADAIESTRSNLHPVIERLVALGVLGREERLGTWWLNDPDLWQIGDSDQADPDRAQRAVAAEERIIADDLLRSNQRELFPLATTDAEVQAEAARARAAKWPATGLPPAQTGPPPARSEIYNEPGEPVIKSRTAVIKNRTTVLNFRTGDIDIDAGTPARARPGNQVILKPGNPGQGGTGGIRTTLDDDGWRLLHELEAFGGPQPAEKRANWAWRIWKKPHVVERALREVQAQVNDPYADTVRSRYGLLKKFWLAWSGEGTAAPPPSRMLAAPAPTAPAPSPVLSRLDQQAAEDAETQERERIEKQALMLRMREEIEAQFFPGRKKS